MTCRPLVLCLGLFLLCLTFGAGPASGQVFHRQLQLPVEGLSERVTRRVDAAAGETVVLFDEAGPGCLMHWWMTYQRGGAVPDRAHEMRLRFFYDGAAEPTVDVSLAQYFSALLENNVYAMDNAAIKVLPSTGVNSYLPTPFEALRIELANETGEEVPLWFMGDWHRYPEGTELTPMRLRVEANGAFPADAYGSYLMADLAGRGFVAGLTMGVREHDQTDRWFHSGGDLVLLDGTTTPRALRGIGGEDLFGMSFGMSPVQTEWVGTAFNSNLGRHEMHATMPRRDEPAEPKAGPYEIISYRVFGPDPIWFESSAVLRFGSRANDHESVVYAYVAPVEEPAAKTVQNWTLAGPFEAETPEQFARSEWAEQPVEEWPERHTPDFGLYRADLKGIPEGEAPVTFAVPVAAQSEHGWLDFARHYRGRGRANVRTQVSGAAAYAVGTLSIDEPGVYQIDVGYDDALALWVEGEKIHDGRHDDGFAVEQIERELPAGEVEVRVKLSNADNFQWRLWAFSLSAEKASGQGG